MGEMHVRCLIKALAALGEEIGNRIAPQEELAGVQRADFRSFWWCCRPVARLRGREPCGKDRRAS
jgi:hypothetical protein